MPQVPVPVLHREGWLGPTPTQLDLVVDLAWCEVRTVAVLCAEFDMVVRPRTERFFSDCDGQRLSEVMVDWLGAVAAIASVSGPAKEPRPLRASQPSPH